MEEEKSDEPKVYEVDDELDWKTILKPYMQPYVLIFFVCVLLLVAAAFYLGYMRGYEHCLIACDVKIQNLTMFV